MHRFERRRIGNQNESYRRGLVLGLTMAEVGILIIFVLLLLLAFGERELRLLYHEVTHEREGIAEVAVAVGLPANASLDDFRRLARTINELARTKDGSAELEEVKAAVQELRSVREGLQRVMQAAAGADPDSITRLIEQQTFRQANQEGQLVNLERRLQAAGEGKGERPCWVEPDGTIDYLYDVVLSTRGIRLREHHYPNRERERALLPAPSFDPYKYVSNSELLQQTDALFAFSKGHGCRFFVVVYDATAAHEKELYKSQLRAVEGHFYKRLENGRPPF